jgi:tetraacyldisaccharide 4'-kinase
MPSTRSRADIIIVTKCPDSLRPIDKRLLEKSLKMFAYQKVFFTKIVYGRPQTVFSNSAKTIELTALKETNASLFVIAGIARSNPFVEYTQTFGNIEKAMLFPDHHSYTVNDLHELVEAFSASTAKTKLIFTTAKDAVKIKQFNNLDDELKAAMYFIPISVAFHENDEKEFNHQISSYVRNNRPDNILYKPKNKK